MRKDRIRKLADTIEKCEAVYGDDQGGDYKFWMGEIQFDCGSPACIAGWAEHIFGEDTDFDLTYLLDISSSDEMELIEPRYKNHAYFPAVRSDHPGFITPQHAAKVLRHFAETGIVDWRVGANA